MRARAFSILQASLCMPDITLYHPVLFGTRTEYSM